MVQIISTSNILDGIVKEIDHGPSSVSITDDVGISVDVGNENYLYSDIDREACARHELKKDDHIKVIFPSNNVVLAPAEPKYSFRSPNLLEGRVEEVGENFVTVNIGKNKVFANFHPEKVEWKIGDEVKAIVRPDDLILVNE